MYSKGSRRTYCSFSTNVINIYIGVYVTNIYKIKNEGPNDGNICFLVYECSFFATAGQ